ncbi:MAG TPA: Hsp20/alpha crystallin family protein [Trueperaceae bacterium]
MELDKLETGSDIRKLITLRDEIANLTHDLEGAPATRPRMDLRDLGDAFELIVEVPGVPERDLEVALDGRKLIVAGERTPDAQEDATLLLSERAGGPFQRSVELPQEVARERTSAHLRAGLLIVHLPKA